MDDYLHVPWLLVATPQLMQPDFEKTVILIVEQSLKGTMGFVINKGDGEPLAEILESEDNFLIPNNIPTWYGGPCDESTGVILHDGSDNNINPTLNTEEALFISSTQESLNSLIHSFHEDTPVNQTNFAKQHFNSLYPYRFITGYAGWESAQIEEEIKLGSWLQIPFSREIVFNTHEDQMWLASLNSIGITPEIISPSTQTYLN